MENDVLELIETLYTMVAEAWGVPLGNDKCILERERVLNILDEIKAQLPTEIAEARRLVNAKTEYIGNAKKDAEAIRKAAEDRSRELVDEQEIVLAAKTRSSEILSLAESRTRELYRVANVYVDDALRRTEEAINSALSEVRQSRSSFRAAANTQMPENTASADAERGSDNDLDS